MIYSYNKYLLNVAYDNSCCSNAGDKIVSRQDLLSHLLEERYGWRRGVSLASICTVVSVGNSFPKTVALKLWRKLSCSWSKGKGFCFVFNMGVTRRYLSMAEWSLDREKINIQRRRAVPVGSYSLKVRV